MFFYLINASIIFQTYINKISKPFVGVFCVVYLDDVLIFSNFEKKHWKHVHKILIVRVWHPIFTWPITTCVLYDDQPKQRPRIWLSSYQYKKKSRSDETQIKIRFYNLFHYLHTLLRCDPVCDRLNADPLMTSRHKQLIVKLESDGQFFFFMKSLVWEIWMFNCLITKKRNFWKKHSKVLY